MRGAPASGGYSTCTSLLSFHAHYYEYYTQCHFDIHVICAYVYMYICIIYVCRLSAIYVWNVLLSLYIFSFLALWISPLCGIHSILFVSRFIPFICQWHMVTLDSECSQNCCCVCVWHYVLKVFSTCIYKETLPDYDVTQLYYLYNTCRSLFRHWSMHQQTARAGSYHKQCTTPLILPFLLTYALPCSLRNTR